MPIATALRQSYTNLLKAAHETSTAERQPKEGEWGGDEILAHVSLVSATTIATAYLIASGVNATYDNRLALDKWSIHHQIAQAGGRAGLAARIAAQAEALSALPETVLSGHELDTTVPSLLLSNGEVVLDKALTLREILGGLAEVEIPGHTAQLLALLVSPEQ